MEENNKKNTKLKIAVIVSWVAFFGLSLLIYEYNLFKLGELFVSVVYLSVLVAAIVFSVKLKKAKPKKVVDKHLIDDNIIAARKIYKKKLRKVTLRDIAATIIIVTVIYIPLMIFIAKTHDKLFLIITASLIPFMTAVGLLSYYVSVKHFFFKYREFVYNGETIVLFTATPAVWGFVHPHFYVVYNGREYSNQGNLVWTGFNAGDPGNLVVAVAQELIDLFNGDRIYSNFLRIDIDTEKSGKLQCIYKIVGGKFIVTDKLDMLKGCFEYTRSFKKNKKDKNNNIDNPENIDDENLENNKDNNE